MGIKVIGLPATSSKGKRFIGDVEPKGEVFKALKSWSKRIVDNYKDVSDRAKQLSEVGLKLEDADQAEMMELTKQVDKIKSSNNKAFERDMDNAVKAMSKYPEEGEKFRAFLAEEVFVTQDHVDFILTDKNWISQVRGILPTDPDVMQNAIRDIEEISKGLANEKPEKSFFEKLMGSKGVSSRSELSKALKETQDQIRDDLEYLRIHREILNKVMFFYKESYEVYINAHEMAGEKLQQLKEEVENED